MRILKNYGLVLFFASAVGLMFLIWLKTGSVNLPEGNDAIWFNSGLFALFIGSFITEYRFTKPNDVFVNCLTVFASVSTLSSPPLAIWWDILRWGAIGCGLLAVALAWDPGREARTRGSILRLVLYKIITAIGSAKVIFSIVFILSLLSYFDLKAPETRVFVLVWGAFLIAAFLEIPSLAQLLLKRGIGGKFRQVAGVTHSFLAPSIVYCQLLKAKSLPIHSFVGFSQSVAADFHAFGIVIGSRRAARESRTVIALLSSSIDASDFDQTTLISEIGENERGQLEAAIDAAELAAASQIIGTVARRSHISQLHFEVFGNPTVTAGSLLRLKGAHKKEVYYQVFDGVVEEEATMEGSARAFVEGRAEQVGCWDSELGGFESHDWVAAERSCVHLIGLDEAPPEHEMKQSEASIGTIPGSNFPANIDIQDLALYHSAILGVTGSGKSFLTFSLVEECAKRGIKVVCVDPTGDYQKYLHDAVMVNQGGALKAFLESDRKIGIIETGRVALHPIRQANHAAQICLDWCKDHRTQEEVLNPHPKVLLIFEEAHLVIPEWNFNPERGLQDVVSATSQIVLQARKYGLGFLVVSQRTANVVKNVLNQCNTIFSFQAFDETGFDFLKNYMGAFHVGSLPNLKMRHGIVVGKASKSRRPIMVHFTQQNRQLRDQPAPDMPVPLPAPAPAPAPEIDDDIP